MTNRDKAENLWQTLNIVNQVLLSMKQRCEELEMVATILKHNKPLAEETEIDQDKQFAKLVYNELPLSSDIPLVNRLISMCEERLNTTDND